MKHLLLLSALFLLCVPGVAQLVAIREMKVPLDGICDNAKVYSMMIFEGQEDQQCSMTKQEIEDRLNDQVTYLRDNPKFKLKKYESVSTLVNCKGELVQVELDTKSANFNQQVCATFQNMEATWTAARMRGTPVDSDHLWGIEIKKGRIVLR